jgi:hypothetical protein
MDAQARGLIARLAPRQLLLASMENVTDIILRARGLFDEVLERSLSLSESSDFKVVQSCLQEHATVIL